ncbi:MAG: rod shape-determining protein MreC [Halanaerobiaceae bacterium]
MNNRLRVFLVILIIVLLLLNGTGLVELSSMDVPVIDFLGRRAFDILSVPLDLFNGVYETGVELRQRVFDDEGIMEENERLQRRVSELEREIGRLEVIRRENDRLRDLLSFKERVSYEVKGARVIGYSPSSWDNKIIIDAGSREGIEEKMPVVSYNGVLVGRVEYAGSLSSQVRLISDSDFVVGGIIEREFSRAIGIVRGQLNSEHLGTMDSIAWDADVREGDLVLTSGFSNSYPRGLAIGTVLSVDSDNYGLSQKAEVDFLFKDYTLEEVLVITDF